MKGFFLLTSVAVALFVVFIGEVKAADIEAVLDDAAGTSAFSVKDSGSVEGAHIDSDGNMVVKGGMRLDSSGVECTTAENLIVDGSVGIGTDNPGSAMDVKGTLRLSGATSGYVGLAPAAAAGSATYTLPSADGTSGQALTTNGAGTLSFSSVTTSPGGANTQVQYNNNSAFGADANFTYDGSGTVTLGTALIVPAIKPSADSTTALQLQTSIGTNVLNVDTTNSRVGIGTTAPVHLLELASGTTAAYGIGFGSDVELYRSAANTLALASGDYFNIVSGSLQFGGNTAITSARNVIAGDGLVTAPGHSFSSDQNTGMYLIAADKIGIITGGIATQGITIDSAGKVGIGTSAPSESLEVYSSSSWKSILVHSDASNAILNLDSATNFDAVVQLKENGTTKWTVFNDGDDGDKFKIGTNTTNIRLTLLSVGNVGIGTTTPGGGTTAGTAVLSLANGTAPVGGVANQSSLYAADVAASSELFAFDEAGNATQISPHDPVTGEWIFYSKNTKTGRVVRVDMERMVKAIEKITGERFMVERFEQP